MTHRVGAANPYAFDAMTFERPPAEPAKLTETWRLWTSGEELPGRTMADLKIGGLDLVLDALVEAEEIGTELIDPWSTWEKGRLTPEAALAALTEAGLGDLMNVIDARTATAE